jgi:hypothetical protein
MCWGNCQLPIYRVEECLEIKADLQRRRSRRMARRRDFLQWAICSREAARPKRLCNRNVRQLCRRTRLLRIEVSKVHLHRNTIMEDQSSRTTNTYLFTISNTPRGFLRHLAGTMALETNVDQTICLNSRTLHNTSKSTLVRQTYVSTPATPDATCSTLCLLQPRRRLVHPEISPTNLDLMSINHPRNACSHPLQ